MKKLKLNVETLAVRSFEAEDAPREAAAGTVHGHSTRPHICVPTYFCTEQAPTADAGC